MKTYLLLAVSLLLSCNNPTETKNSSDLSLNAQCANSIYKHLNSGIIFTLQVEYFKSLYATSPGKMVTITDTDTIKKVTALLRALPDTGEIMVKFGPDASFNKLILVDSEAKADTVILIDNRIKTPATSFYHPAREEENALVKLVIDTCIQKSLCDSAVNLPHYD